MWWRIQSEGFITALWTGGDIFPNWGHQDSCCRFLSAVQITSSFFNLFISATSLSLSLSRIALISSLLWWCPLVCIWSGGTVQEHPCCMRVKRWRECRVCERKRQRFAVCRVEPQLDIWGRLTYSLWHRHVINRINLSPNALMIAVLIYVNQFSLLTHYHQFAPDIHNRPLLALTNIYFC